MHILYVEDDPFDADLTRRALQRTAPHFDLSLARSYTEALLKLSTLPLSFDLLLTDLRLPDGTGFSLLSHVRENKLPLAVVVITGQGDEEIAVSALKAGANDYLVKRQNYLDHLASTLENALQRYKAEEARRERPLQLLYLDNHLNDIEATRRHFAGHAPHIHLDVVHTTRELFQHLPPRPAPLAYDALMVDYHQQDLGALDLLKELRQARGLELPIVLVTARGDEELAAQALRLGASDYVAKSPGYLFGLPGLMENAYHRAQLQRERAALEDSEERYRRLAENAPDIIYRMRRRPRLQVEYVSPAAEAITGYTPAELVHDIRKFVRAIVPGDLKSVRTIYEIDSTSTLPVIFRFRRRDGCIIWLEGRNVAILDASGQVIAHEGILRDVTERRQSEEHIQRQLQRLNALRTIDMSITGNRGLQSTLEVLLNHVILQLSAHAAGILLFASGGARLEYRASRGFQSGAFDYLPIDALNGPAGRIIQTGQTVHVSAWQEICANPILAEAWSSEAFVSYYGAPLIAKGQTLGVLEVYHRSPFTPDDEWLNFLETLAGQAAIAIDNARLLEDLQHANRELTQAYDITLEGWVSFLDLRDQETLNHTQRVTEMTLRLASVMGIPETQLVHIKRGAMLHDIGKMGISDSILIKNGPLTEEEMVTMRLHPQYAYDALSSIDYLRPALDIPHSHHERWDGTGYPNGLKGEDIPLAARIFAVVDVWDALSSDRHYRKKWPPEQVVAHLLAERGKHFDPLVVDKFLELLETVK
jgi:PAS domain S-box-containing protein